MPTITQDEYDDYQDLKRMANSEDKMFIGSPNRIKLSWPGGKLGLAVKVTDIRTGHNRELSTEDLMILAHGGSI